MRGRSAPPPRRDRREGLRPLGSKSPDLAPAPRSGGWRPPHPHEGALRPSTPGDFPVAGKVTKGAPRAAPFGILRCKITALFALAYASRRAGFCHKNRPICHFELGEQTGLYFSPRFCRENFLLLIRGAGVLVARLGATFGGIRGIGEGGFCVGRRLHTATKSGQRSFVLFV